MATPRRPSASTMWGVAPALAFTLASGVASAQQIDAPIPLPPVATERPSDEAAPPVPVAPDGTAVLHIASADPVDVALFPRGMRPPPPEMTQHACRTPCELPVPPGDYTIVADRPGGPRTTGSVRAQWGGRLSLAVRPGRIDVGGIALIVVGSISTATGGGLLVAAGFTLFIAALCGSSCASGALPAAGWMALGGLGAGVVGAALLAPGIALTTAARGRIAPVRVSLRPVFGRPGLELAVAF